MRRLMARLGSRRVVAKEGSGASEAPVEDTRPSDEGVEAGPEPVSVEDEAEAPAPSTNGVAAEVTAATSALPEPLPPGEAQRPVPAAPRPLPSFRPREAQDPRTETDASPLTLTLSEAIQLVHDSGGDAMELRFLRRELQRRGREGNEPADLWPRVEQAVTGRLRRVGRLAEGQPLTLLRDPNAATRAGSSPGS